jgi:hypothetical protein
VLNPLVQVAAISVTRNISKLCVHTLKIIILSPVLVTIEGVWFGEYTQSTRTYKLYRVIADLHNLQFPVIHALGFSVLTSRTLVRKLKQSHCD